MNALRIGLRFALSGGRSARARAALTALGVASGVVLLLLAASVPNVIDARADRQAAREPQVGKPARGRDRLLLRYVSTEYRGEAIGGREVDPQGPGAPVPPGIERLPAPGELVVSPALQDLLASPDGSLLRERLPGTIVGTVASDGLAGPDELLFYRGADDLVSYRDAACNNVGCEGAETVARFGNRSPGENLPAWFIFIAIVGVVVMLLPVAIFVATAVRFGGEQRDRRLAALRLIGADRLMTARVAAGEALAGALGGLVLGAVGFLALRPLAERVTLQDFSVFAGDVAPSLGLAALIVIGVPVSAVLVSVVAMRRVAVEPLGVIRLGAGARRRLWWRLLPIVAGVALLWGLRSQLTGPTPSFDEAQLSVGLVLVLVGLTALLPWVVEAAVRRLRGGSLSWQLATRRLQLDSSTAARVVSGVAVAVAGAIALQSVLAAGEREATFPTNVDLTRADATASAPVADAATTERMLSRLRDTPGIERAVGATEIYTRRTAVIVGGCMGLREYARLPECKRGDAFLAGVRPRDARGLELPAGLPHVPTRNLPAGYASPAVLATPGSIDLDPVGGGGAAGIAHLKFVRGDRDAIERARNVVAAIAPSGSVYPLGSTAELPALRTVRRGIYIGAVLILLLIGASLLIGGLEQLRERRPVLAAIAAFGTPRRVMARSILWQAAIPVTLGVGVAAIIGVGLGALLIKVGGRPVEIDWGAVAAMAGSSAAVILLVTVLTLPALIRMSRPAGLRAE